MCHHTFCHYLLTIGCHISQCSFNVSNNYWSTYWPINWLSVVDQHNQPRLVNISTNSQPLFWLSIRHVVQMLLNLQNPTFNQKRIIILYFLAGVHQGTIIMYWGRLCRPSHKSNQPLFRGVCDMFPMLTMSRGTKTVGAMSINCFRGHRHPLCSYGAGRPFKCVNF